MPKIPIHLQKKRGPKPKKKQCLCSRPMFRMKGKYAVCEWCSSLEKAGEQKRHTEGLRRRADVGLAVVEPFGWYDGGMNGRYNL